MRYRESRLSASVRDIVLSLFFSLTIMGLLLLFSIVVDYRRTTSYSFTQFLIQYVFFSVFFASCISFRLILGRSYNFLLITVLDDGIEITRQIHKTTCSSIKIRWDAITAIQCKKGFPHFLPFYTVKLLCQRGIHGNALLYRLISNDKIETVLPWPLDNPQKFKSEVLLHSPENNPLRAFVLSRIPYASV